MGLVVHFPAWGCPQGMRGHPRKEGTRREEKPCRQSWKSLETVDFPAFMEK